MDENRTPVLMEDLAKEAISAVMNTVGVIASTPEEVEHFLKRLAYDLPLQEEVSIFDAFSENENYKTNIACIKLYLQFLEETKKLKTEQ